MSRRLSRVGDALIPTASRTKVHFCPKGHLHLLGLDEVGNPLCEIIVGRKLMMVIVDALTDSTMTDDED